MYSRNNFSRFSYFRTFYPCIPITMHGLFVRGPPSMLYLGASQKVSFFLDFLFVLLLLSQETPPIRGGLDNPACHTHTHTLPNTISLSSLLSSLLKIRKVYFSQNVVLRQMSLRASVCPAVTFFCKFLNLKSWFLPASLSRNWWKCKKKALT